MFEFGALLGFVACRGASLKSVLVSDAVCQEDRKP